jgi:2-dehydro-3-deoxyphosphogluconate aldolase/(4S)-4-hydroxy-2-oxoglutarate aldolase
VDVKKFKALPLLGILRDIDEDTIGPLVETVVASGLATIEVTMNTGGAATLIKKAVKIARDSLIIGAGTVLDLKDLKSATDSGATFVVMPVFIEGIVKYCMKNKIPVFPGAMTPQEIYLAWRSGATMVKVFPSGLFGPAYFRELKGPFKDIELLACGGVTPENMKDYFASGASAVAFGASVFRKDWLAARDFAKIGSAIRRFTDAMPVLREQER